MEEEDKWKNHPGTRSFVKGLKERRDNTISSLLKAAFESSDPRVRGHACSIEAIDKLIREIENGKK